jgi:hypothetical protein
VSGTFSAPNDDFIIVRILPEIEEAAP